MFHELWNFGALDKNLEKLYIQKMIQRIGLNPVFSFVFQKAIIVAQTFIKEKIEKNQVSVSLRDIKRVVKIFKFYSAFQDFRKNKKNYLQSQISDSEQNQKIEKQQISGKYRDFDDFVENWEFDFGSMDIKTFKTSFIITLLANYLFRINSKGKKIFTEFTFTYLLVNVFSL